MSLKVGFTGTRRGLTVVQARVLASELEHLRPSLFIHGGCVGADNEADMIAVNLGVERRVLPAPAGKDRVTDANLIWRTNYHTGRGTTITIHSAQPPLVRNKQIVAECDVLIACPAQQDEILRSGTWATVRAARKAGKRIILIGPGGIK